MLCCNSPLIVSCCEQHGAELSREEVVRRRSGPTFVGHLYNSQGQRYQFLSWDRNGVVRRTDSTIFAGIWVAFLSSEECQQ